MAGGPATAAPSRTAAGDERARLWERALEFWPPYADYQKKVEREIPVLVTDPVRCHTLQGETAVPFYEKGDVRIRYEETGSGFPLLVTPGAA